MTPVTQCILWPKPAAVLLNVWSSPVLENSFTCLKLATCGQVSLLHENDQRSGMQIEGPQISHPCYIRAIVVPLELPDP